MTPFQKKLAFNLIAALFITGAHHLAQKVFDNIDTSEKNKIEN